MPWTRDDADHLLRRAGFGGSLGDVDRIFALGQAGAVSALVDYESTPDPTWSNSSTRLGNPPGSRCSTAVRCCISTK